VREQRRGQDRRSTEQPDGDEGHHERARGADGTTEDLRLEVLQPRSVIMPPGPVRDGSGIYPLVEVRRRRRRRQASEQRQEPRRPADLGRAGRASFDVGREPRRVLREQVVHEERVDQLARGRVIEWLARCRSRAHIL
jgi:hypothetical protein